MQDYDMTDVEQKEWDLKLRKMDAEISKLLAETAHISRTSVWYPLVTGSGIAVAFIGVAVGLFKVFLIP